jgi:hypothetical protein
MVSVTSFFVGLESLLHGLQICSVCVLCMRELETYKQQALLRGLISSLFSGTDSSLDEFDKIKEIEEKLGTLVRVLLE